MKHAAEVVIRHIGARIALFAQGEEKETAKDGVRMFEFSLPGGTATLEIIPDEGMAMLFDRNGAPLCGGSIKADDLFVSVMQNCDCEISRGLKRNMPVELLELADALAESREEGARRALQYVTGLDLDWKPDYMRWEIAPEIVEFAEALRHCPDERVAEAAKEVSFAARGSTRAQFSYEWSLHRWAARVNRWTSGGEPIPSENGSWHKIDSIVGHLEACMALGWGSLSKHGEYDHYALRMQGHGTGIPNGEIAAVAVYENGELNNVLKHFNPLKRPKVRISRDLERLIDHVENNLAVTESMTPSPC